jgi:hypothetical protein
MSTERAAFHVEERCSKLRQVPVCVLDKLYFQRSSAQTIFENITYVMSLHL